MKHCEPRFRKYNDEFGYFCLYCNQLIKPDEKLICWHGDVKRQEIADKLNELVEFFGTPVMPVTQYCEAFDKWAEAIKMGNGKWNNITNSIKPPEGYRTEYPHGEEFVDYLDKIGMAIMKSNLMWRLLYGGEKLRTKICPVHKGRWSGTTWDKEIECVKLFPPHGCLSGDNITGWLNDENTTSEITPEGGVDK